MIRPDAKVEKMYPYPWLHEQVRLHLSINERHRKTTSEPHQFATPTH